MKKIKSIFIKIIFVFSVFHAPTSRADLFGGDVAMLGQILFQTIQQLIEMKKILDTGQETYETIKEINDGINDAIKKIESLNPKDLSKLYKDWSSIEGALKKLEELYGKPIASPEFEIETNSDAVVSEAVNLNNSIFKYSKRIERIGEEIKLRANLSSPKGAAKLTAQSMGVMLHVMNESLKAQALGLKLQAQESMIRNRAHKKMTENWVEGSKELGRQMSDEGVGGFKLPSF